MRKKDLGLIIATALTFHCTSVIAQPLDGKYSASPEWGSGWLDLAKPINIKSGTCLRIEVGGSASKVLIRFLSEGENPDLPIGISGGIQSVPNTRVLMAQVTHDYSNVIQISIHGNPDPWQFDLGTNNGPATLDSIEAVSCNNTNGR